jgi:hypothetical protein
MTLVDVFREALPPDAIETRPAECALLSGGISGMAWPCSRAAAAGPTRTASRHCARPAARAPAHRLRAGLIEVVDAAGAEHLQIGCSHAAHPAIDDCIVAGWRALKARHDPDGIMNPGVLGLSPRMPDSGAGERDEHFARRRREPV